MTKSTYQPPYTITPEILNRFAAISEAIGRLAVLTDQARALRYCLSTYQANDDGYYTPLRLTSLADS